MGISIDESALAGYLWGTGSKKDKAQLYQQRPELREVFMGLPDDKFSILLELDPSLWPELLGEDYRVLNRRVEDAEILMRVLAKLPPLEAIKAFGSISNSTRKAVISRLTPESRKNVEAIFTQTAPNHANSDSTKSYDSGHGKRKRGTSPSFQRVKFAKFSQ